MTTASGADQHLVPQMMIRQFAGDDGKLSELDKPTLVVRRRRRGPKGILFLKDFYRDHVSDLDDELLKPIEQKFARLYPQLANEAKPKLSGEAGAALVDWVASMLVRTRAYACLSTAVAQKQGGLCSVTWDLVPKLMTNIARILWFSEYQDLLSRPNFQWKLKTYRDEETVVLSDFPVLQTSGTEAGGPVTIIPLTKRRVLFAGSGEAVDRWDIPAESLNLWLAAYADRSVFAANSKCLERIAEHLRVDCAWSRAARHPFFGFLDRLPDQKIPSDVDVSQWWDGVKDSYGRSILPSR
jgi:hypothetical protein